MNAKSSRATRICVLLVILVFCSSDKGAALDPHQTLSQLYHTSWSAKEGVNGYVSSLAQTTDGYLWVGTSEGLFRFDGMSFEQFQPETGSLPATMVNVLMAVPDGGLWVGFYRGGASFIRNGRVTSYSDSEGFPVATVRSFARDSAGAIWAATTGGLARFDGQHWEKIHWNWNYPSKTAQRLMVDREGTLWVTTGGQIVFLPKSEKRFQDTGIHARKALSLAEAPDGSILFYDAELKKLRAFRQHDKKIELLGDIDDAAEMIMFDRDGALWLGNPGLSRIPFPQKVRGFKFKEAAERFSADQRLTNDSVYELFEDREGNVWVGTDGGLDRFRARNVKVFALRGGPFSLVEGTHGDIWAGSSDQNPLVRVQDGKPAVERISKVNTSYRDPDTTIWYAANNLLLHFKNGRFVNTRLPPSVLKLSFSVIPRDPSIASAITKDRSGNLWVAFGGSGEFRLKDGKWNFVVILPDHPDWAANYAITDNKDRVWLSFGDRVACYDHGKVQAFGFKEGFAVGPTNVIAAGDEDIWVGGESGLALLQSGQFHTIRTTGDTGFTQVSGIVVARNAGLWLSTTAGIVHIPESEIQNVVQHPEHKVAFELFDLVSDLPEPIQQREDVYSSGAIQAHDGSIWFGTRNGAVEIDPNHIYRNPLLPPVSIRSIVADQKSYSVFSSPALPALTRNLQIGYAALSLSVPERVRFRYKLEGFENEWHEAGSRRQAYFTHLAPGSYTFRVIACNNDGVWNDAGAALNFTVAPAWFQTGWFRAFCVGIFGLLMWTIYQLRVQQLKRRFAFGLEARVNERTRIARDLHDTLLQSFQGLMLRLQLVEDLLPEGKAKNQLEQTLQRADQAIAEGRRAVYDLRSTTAAPTDLAQAVRSLGDEFATENSAAFRLMVEGTGRDLNPIIRDELCLITREALRNAFSHAHAQHIEAEITYGGRAFRLRIRDDGEGIPTQILEEGRPGHYGLSGMRERAKQIGGKLELWSRAGAGTEIDLSIPGSVAYRTSVTRPLFSLFGRKAG